MSNLPMHCASNFTVKSCGLGLERLSSRLSSVAPSKRGAKWRCRKSYQAAIGPPEAKAMQSGTLTDVFTMRELRHPRNGISKRFTS
jgi:hypothetical protein